MNPTTKRALEYVRNTGGFATVAHFDDDHEPIGPVLRKELMPGFVTEINGFLFLTDEGRAELSV